MTCSTEVPRGVTVVDGGHARVGVHSLRELWAFREVLVAFVRRHVKVRYKQAGIGIAWALVQPVVSAALFTIVFGRLSGVGSEGAPYPLFVLCGMVLWTYFANGAGQAMESLITDQALLKKVYFPRELLPMAAVIATIVDLIPGLVTLLVLASVLGYFPGAALVALVIPVLLAIVSASAVGLLLAAVNVYYRDVRHALPFVFQLGMFASPVVYSADSIPATWRGLYLVANPIAASIDGLRDVVLHHQAPSPLTQAAAFAWAIIGLACSYFIFKRLERSFADRI